MEQSSRNFQPSSSDRKFQAIFASPNRYFRENSCWVPLNKYKLDVPKPHTEFYKRSLSHSRNVLWNSLTSEVPLTSLYVFKGKLKNANLEICIIFTRPPCKACKLLLLLLQYLNEIPCINSITLPACLTSVMCINGFRQQTSSGYQQYVLK